MTIDREKLISAVELLLETKSGLGAYRESQVRAVIAGTMKYSALPQRSRVILGEIVKLSRVNPAQAMTILDMAAAKREQFAAEVAEEMEAGTPHARTVARASNYRARIKAVLEIASLKAGRELTKDEQRKAINDYNLQREADYRAYLDSHPELGYRRGSRAFTAELSAKLQRELVELRKKKEQASKPVSDWMRSQQIINR
jgi:hypothetical protein